MTESLPLPEPAGGGDGDRPSPPSATAGSGRHCREQLWYALSLPALASEPAAINRRRLEQLATLLAQFSDRISVRPPDGLVFEARASLRYVGGLRAMRRQISSRIRHQLHDWGLEQRFYQAATPTASASLLLAGSGCNRLVHSREQLRSALGDLELETLPISRDRKRQLRRSGLRQLRDLWRLPQAGLRKRLGREVTDHLERCLGRRPDPLPRWQPPTRFHASLEADWPLETLPALLPLIEELLIRLQHFLQRRQLRVRHLQLRLRHEARTETPVELLLRQPSQSSAHLLMLLQTRLEASGLAAAVIGASVQAGDFQARIPSREELAPEPATRRAKRSGWVQLQEQLQARLGPQCLRQLRAIPVHCPEQASRCRRQEDAESPDGAITDPSTTFAALPPRPGWLLEPPRPLSKQLPGLTLLDGPERIETGWWTGREIRRDYYIARDRHGKQLWIFREHGSQQWFLHGLFA